VGTHSASTKVTLTNSTGTSITLSTPALSFTGPFVSATGTTCSNGLVIASKGTCIIEVQFAPTATGYASGLLSVFDNNSTSPQTVALSGTGSGVQLSPTSINFGQVTDGFQTSSTVTLTNVGTTTLTLEGFDITGVNSVDFSYSNGCGSSLGAGQNCTITVYFDPSKVGAESATFKLFDNGLGSPQSVALAGTGLAN
jgi:hypothetical protein